MDWSIVIALVALVLGPAGAYISARVSRRKEPEERENIITESMERAVRVVRAELERCLEERSKEIQRLQDRLNDLQRQVNALQARALRLEDEVRRLGGDPSKIH